MLITQSTTNVFHTWDFRSLWRIFLSWTCFMARQIWTNQSIACSDGYHKMKRVTIRLNDINLWSVHSTWCLLGQIQDLAKGGLNLWVLKAWQARGVQGHAHPGKFYLERRRHHFPGFQGEFEAKKGVQPNPSTTPPPPPRSVVVCTAPAPLKTAFPFDCLSSCTSPLWSRRCKVGSVFYYIYISTWMQYFVPNSLEPYNHGSALSSYNNSWCCTELLTTAHCRIKSYTSNHYYLSAYYSMYSVVHKSVLVS